MSLGFVSEAEIDDKRKKRQEEWDKVRKPEDPEICPEEPYDGRSLYERLKEQKDKQEDEISEQYKIKNMVKGLESDEVEFLESVDKQKAEQEKTRWLEEQEAIAELKNRIAVATEDGDAKLAAERATSTTRPTAQAASASNGVNGKHVVATSSNTTRSAQRALLSGVIKRKRSSSSDADASGEKRQERDSESRAEPVAAEAAQSVSDECAAAAKPVSAEAGSGPVAAVAAVAAQVIGYLPGISSYGNPSDATPGDSDESSDSASSDSDIDGCQDPCKQQGQKVGGSGKAALLALQAKYRPNVMHMD